MISHPVLIGLAVALAIVLSAELSRRTRVPEPCYLVLAGLGMNPRFAGVLSPLPDSTGDRLLTMETSPSGARCSEAVLPAGFPAGRRD